MNTNNNSCEIFNKENYSDLIELEQKLFTAFVQKIPNKRIQSKYKVIDNNRLRPHISYSEQTVFLLKRDNYIISATGLHFPEHSPYQLHDFNFDYNIKEKFFCEGLFFFVHGLSGFEIFGLSIFFDFINEHLKKKKIKHWYGTCDSSLISIYKHFGCEVLESCEHDNNIIVLFRFKVI